MKAIKGFISTALLFLAESWWLILPKTKNRKPKTALMEDRLQSLAFLAKSLGDENRLRILLALKNGRKPVSQIVEDVQLSQPLVSHHLKELKRSLLVKMERQGPFVFYEMADLGILRVLRDLDALAVQLLADRSTDTF